MKKSVSKKLSVAISAAILASTMGTSYFSVLANPLPAAGSTYPVTNAIPGYMDSAMASRMINSVTTYQAGNYYVFKVSQGMINISKASNAPGIWINPIQNTAAADSVLVPVAPVTAPATSTATTMKTTASLNMRKGPSTSYQSILVIPKGATVKLVEDKGEWKRITYNGSTGWSSGKYLSVVSVSSPVTVPVAPPASTVPNAGGAIYKTTGNLYMRTGPAKTTASILVIPYGANVVLVEDGGEWKKVTYSGKTGWASGKYLQLVQAAPVPVAPAPPVVTPDPPAPVEPAPPIVVTPDPPAPVEPTPPPTEVVTPTPVPEQTPEALQKKTTGALNMRSGAGTQYASIMVLPKGAVVEVIGASGKWLNIIYQGKTGWASGDYLTEVTGVYKVLNVPYHSQLTPVYAPVGCEATALLMGLQYKGIAKDVTYRQFLDAMPKHPSNPEKGFAGSPYILNNSIRTTIYPQALTDYANTYAAGRTVNFSGSTVDDIKKEILAGNPVVVYLTVKRAAPIYANYIIEGTTQSLLKNNHAVLVTGYDSEANKLRITDPWSWSGRNEYWLDIPTFAYSYNIRNHSISIR